MAQREQRVNGNELLDSNGVPMVPFRKVLSGARTLTAEDNGASLIYNTAAGYTITLPAAQPGLFFRVAVTTTITSSAARLACATGDFFIGTILQSIDTTFAPTARTADGSTHLAWEGNGTTTGGIIGDVMEIHAISDTQWLITGFNTATGTEATPFKTS